MDFRNINIIIEHGLFFFKKGSKRDRFFSLANFPNVHNDSSGAKAEAKS